MTTSPCILLLSYFLHAFVTNCILLCRQFDKNNFGSRVFAVLYLSSEEAIYVVFGLIAASQECQEIVAIYSKILKAYGCRLICSKQLMVFYSYRKIKQKVAKTACLLPRVDPSFALTLSREYIKVKKIIYFLSCICSNCSYYEVLVTINQFILFLQLISFYSDISVLCHMHLSTFAYAKISQ
jgi:hypothetical protein